MTRHSWSDPERHPHETYRECRQCKMMKVTHHEGDRHWTEFYKDGERIPGTATPSCEYETEDA